MPKKIKIILAEDHQLVREAFATLIREQADFSLTEVAANGRELLDLLKIHSPDLILLDINMPVMDGKQCLEMIRKRFPAMKVVILSMHSEPAIMSEFMANGANAYLNKNVDTKTLFEALRTVHQEGVYFNTELSKALLTNLKKGKPGKGFFDQKVLSERELEILKELCEGKTNKAIADSLFISINTVDFHRGNIYMKTKCNNIASLVKYAIKHELISI